MKEGKYRYILEAQVLGSCLNGGYKNCHYILTERNFLMGKGQFHAQIWRIFEELAPTKPIDSTTVGLALLRKTGAWYKEPLYELTCSAISTPTDYLALALLEFDIRSKLRSEIVQAQLKVVSAGPYRVLLNLRLVQEDVENEQLEFFDIISNLEDFLKENSDQTSLCGLIIFVSKIPKRVQKVKDWTHLREAVKFINSKSFAPLDNQLKDLTLSVDYFLRKKGGCND